MRRGKPGWLIPIPQLDQKLENSPALIISNDAIGKLPQKVIMPRIGWQDRSTSAEWMVRIEPDRNNELGKVGAFDAVQIRSVDVQHLVGQVGYVSKHILEPVEEAVVTVISDD